MVFLPHLVAAAPLQTTCATRGGFASVARRYRPLFVSHGCAFGRVFGRSWHLWCRRTKCCTIKNLCCQYVRLRHPWFQAKIGIVRRHSLAEACCNIGLRGGLPRRRHSSAAVLCMTPTTTRGPTYNTLMSALSFLCRGNLSGVLSLSVSYHRTTLLRESFILRVCWNCALFVASDRDTASVQPTGAPCATKYGVIPTAPSLANPQATDAEGGIQSGCSIMPKHVV